MHEHFPLPDVAWPPLRPFWDGAAAGRLLLPRCSACDRFDWYPTEVCASCGAADRTWDEVSGRATLFSWAVVRHAWVPAFAPLLPFVSGLVAIEEEPRVRLATTIVDADPGALVMDMPVEVTFRPRSFPPSTTAVVMPHFRPAATGPA